MSWTAPTQNTDGSALTDLIGYGVYRRCGTGALTQIATLPPSPLTYTDTVADGQTCWWSLTAIATSGTSARTNEVSKALVVDAPGSVSATFTWTTRPVTIGTIYNAHASNESNPAVAVTVSVVVPAEAVYAVVAFGQNSPGGDANPAAPEFNGSATGVTLAGSIGGADWGRCGIYVLDSPPTGTYNVVGNVLTNNRPYMMSVFFFDSFASLGTFASANGNNATPNATVNEQVAVSGASGDTIISVHSDDMGTGNGGSRTSNSGTAAGLYTLGGGDGFDGAQYETAAGSITTARFTIQDGPAPGGNWAICGIAVR